MRSLLRWLAVVSSVGMLLVLVMGAAVTNTGSAEGCGRSWPLCHGQFIPEFTIATAIEYSHRAVSGIEGLLVLALTVLMLRLWGRDRQVQILAPLMLGTLLLQAGLGAGAVMWPQSDAVLASHFGVSLVCFAATFLSAAYVLDRTGASRRSHREAYGLAPARDRADGPRGAAMRSDDRRLPTDHADGVAGRARRGAQSVRAIVLGVGVYVMLVVYLGAYVRHAGIALACTDWPLCNGEVVPPLDAVTGIVFAHRLAALGAMVLIGWMAMRAQAAGVAPRVAWAAFALVVLQALSGAFVVWTRLGLYSTLAHATIMAILFACLAFLVREVLLEAEPVEQRNAQPDLVVAQT